MDKKKKLFLISNMYPSEQFLRYGVFVKNFEIAISEHFIVEKLVLKRLRNKYIRLLGYLRLYLRIIKLIFVSNKNELIYVHFPLHLAPALWLLSYFRKNIVLNFHGSDLVFDSLHKRLLAIFLNPLISKFNIVVPSNYYRDKIINIYNIQHESVYVYPSGGVDIEVFRPIRSDIKDEFVLGYVSHFGEAKGWKLFLDSIEKLIRNEELSNVKVVMVGDGPDKDKVEQYLASLDVYSEIHSNINHKELAKVYNKLDLFIFPTFMDESLGLVGLEAMACGVPVIASNTGGPSSYVQSGINGFIFKNKDVNDLHDKIITYYTLSTKEKEKMKCNALQTSRNYSCDVVNGNLINYLKSLKCSLY